MSGTCNAQQSLIFLNTKLECLLLQLMVVYGVFLQVTSQHWNHKQCIFTRKQASTTSGLFSSEFWGTTIEHDIATKGPRSKKAKNKKDTQNQKMEKGHIHYTKKILELKWIGGNIGRNIFFPSTQTSTDIAHNMLWLAVARCEKKKSTCESFAFFLKIK